MLAGIQVYAEVIKDLKLVVHEIEILGIKEEEKLKEGWKIYDKNTKHFIIENDLSFQGWFERLNEAIRKLRIMEEERIKIEKEILLAEDECKRALKEKEMHDKYEKLVENMEIMMSKLNNKPRAKCFKCGKLGHVASKCYSNLNKSDNSYNLNFCKNMKIKEHKNLNFLIEKFSKLFDVESPIDFCEIEECKIKTPDNLIIKIKGNRIPQALEGKVAKKLHEMEEKQIIQKSKSEWRIPIKVVMRKNGDVRITQNYIPLNKHVELESNNIPNLNELISSVSGAKFITVCDLKDAFYSIKIRKEDRCKTAFEFKGQVFEMVGMPMGYKNSPMIMQRVISRILSDIENVKVYLDDIVIYGNTENEHDKAVIEVFKQLQSNGMRLNREKIQYKLQEVNLLGARISGQSKSAKLDTVIKAIDYKRPEKFKELRGFLGLVNWFSEYIPDLAVKIAPLSDALKQGTKKLTWNNNMNQAFEGIKSEMRKIKPLAQPDYSRKFLLRTDASEIGLGATLMQQREKSDEWIPVRWASKKLTNQEKKWGISEKEMYAIKWGLSKFSYELKGRKFIIETDHKCLEEITRKPNFKNKRISRWIDEIQEFDFDIFYRKGKTMEMADAFSRLHKNKIENQGDVWKGTDGIERTIVEEGQRKDYIRIAHENVCHRGINETNHELVERMHFYWPYCKSDIASYIKNCKDCNINNKKNYGGATFVSTKEQNEKWGVDVMEFNNKTVLVVIDYYSRYTFAKIMRNHTSLEIINALNEHAEKVNYPKEIIVDNAKEFVSQEFSEFCVKK